MKKISIVIPVYNVVNYLSRSVESILANDTEDCELILVDDGSTDGSGPLCDQFAAAHPELIRVIHQKNSGPGCARNAGIAASEGAWFLFLDSDDKLTPDAITVLKQAADRGDAQVIGFQFHSEDENGALTPGDTGYPPTDAPFTLSERKPYLLSLPSVALRMWSRDLFTETGVRFPPTVWYEDARTSVKLLPLAKGIRVLPDRLYLYLQRQGSIMNNRNLERNREILAAFDDILQWYRDQGLAGEYEQELCALTVQHVLLAASVRIVRVDRKCELLKTLRDYTDRAFPNWKDNPYLKKLPKSKAVALWLIRNRKFGLLSMLLKLKG